MRCFISVDSPPDVKDRLFEVGRILKDFGEMTLVKPENMHLTLKFLGKISEEQAGKVSGALDALQFKAYDVKVAGVGVFPKHDYVRVVWAGVEDGGKTVELARMIDGLLEPLGFPAEKDFRPHLTVARVKFLRDKSRLNELIATRLDEVFGSFTAGRLLLMKSVLSPKGPEYSTLKEVNFQ